MGRTLPRARRARPAGPLQRASEPPYPSPDLGARADRVLATDEEVVRAPDRPRARRRARLPLLRENGDALAGPARTESDPRHHPRRREPSPTREDHRPLPGPHGPHGREEGREDPRRRRLVGPRPRQRTGPRRQTRPQAEGRLHLPPLDGGRVLPPGLHRGARGRESRHDHHLLPPRPSLLRCPRHHQDLPPGHRQRRELHRHGVPPLDLRVHRTPPAHADLHSPP